MFIYVIFLTFYYKYLVYIYAYNMHSVNMHEHEALGIRLHDPLSSRKADKTKSTLAPLNYDIQP